MSDCRFGVSPVNYPDPDPDPEGRMWDLIVSVPDHCLFSTLYFVGIYYYWSVV